MAVFTTADRDAVKAAIITAATTGIASVTVGGQTVTKMTLDQLLALLERINADLASDQSHLGLRMTQLIPPGAG